MRQYIVVLVLFFGLYSVVNAQQEFSLNFEEAVAIALTKQVDFQKLQNQQEVLRMERINAQLGYLPRLTANSATFRQVGQQFQQVEGELIVTNQVNSIVTGGLNASAPVFNGFRQHQLSKASRSFEEAGLLGLERGRQEVFNSVAQQYLQTLLSEELVTISKENLAIQQAQLEQIQGFLDAGLRTIADLYNQQSEVARLQAVVVDSELQWERNRWLLAEILQLDKEVLPVLAPISLEVYEQQWLSLPLEDLYREARLGRRDLQQQQKLVEGQKRMLAVSRAGFYPQLNAFFNYSTFFTSLDERTFSNQFFTIFPQRSFGLNLSIPIFTNFDNKLDVTRSKVNLHNQQLDLHAMERIISQEVKLAYQGLKAAVKRMEATTVQLEAAQEAHLAISERFRLGLSNFVDLAQANQQLVTAQSDHAQARYTLYFQELQVKFALGEELE
jgi:outer membrane protein